MQRRGQLPVPSRRPTADALKLHVRKVVVGSDLPPSSVQLHGRRTDDELSSLTALNEVTLPAGTYTVTEPPVAGLHDDDLGLHGRRHVLAAVDGSRLHDHEHRRDRATCYGSRCARSSTGSYETAERLQLHGRWADDRVRGGRRSTRCVLPAGTYDGHRAAGGGVSDDHLDGCTDIVLASPAVAIPSARSRTPPRVPLLRLRGAQGRRRVVDRPPSDFSFTVGGRTISVRGRRRQRGRAAGRHVHVTEPPVAGFHDDLGRMHRHRARGPAADRARVHDHEHGRRRPRSIRSALRSSAWTTSTTGRSRPPSATTTRIPSR